MIRNPKVVRAVALYLLIQFTTSIIYPSVSFALTSGPSQPEFSSFEPVATTNMVDEFSSLIICHYWRFQALRAAVILYHFHIIVVPVPRRKRHGLDMVGH
jgi:hypothetical protein